MESHPSIGEGAREGLCEGTRRKKQKTAAGFAHRFRPTYPGFPVAPGGIEQDHVACFEKGACVVGLASHSRKSGRRRFEHGAPVRAWGALKRHEGRAAVSHICQKQADMGHPASVEGMEPKACWSGWPQVSLLRPGCSGLVLFPVCVRRRRRERRPLTRIVGMWIRGCSPQICADAIQVVDDLSVLNRELTK